ncbi:MAG: lecithin retinol acyltransferase family protein [Bacteroidia bacterium]
MRKFLHTLNSLRPGDRIVVPKSYLRMVQHHAIYLGFEKGQHWIIENKEVFGVRVVSAATFLAGVDEITRIDPFYPKNGYSRNDLVRYALSKKGRRYHLTNYNCEHFANEIQYRVVQSKQADTGVGIALFGLAVLLIGGIAGRR